MQMVALEKFEDSDESDRIRQLIQRHADYTQSQRAAKILALWEKYSGQFVKVMPKDYKRVLQSLKKAKQQGLSGEDAINAAFEENSRDLARVGGG
jgi:glutamate synthase (ferredoxin)